MVARGIQTDNFRSTRGMRAVGGPVAASWRASKLDSRPVFTVAFPLHGPTAGMTVPWYARYPLLLVVGLTAGCGGMRSPVVMAPQRVSQRLDEADRLARIGRYADARDGYAAVLAEGGTRAAGALLGMARLALDPKNPERDERRAVGYLDLLLFEYPYSGWAAEAGTWLNLLRSVERLQRDVRRHQQDLERLRRELQHEQQETARFRQERERLREIDLKLERPGPVILTPSPAQTSRE